MAKKVVVDSSVIVKWVSSQDEKHLKQADKILQDAQTGKIEVYSADLARYEVGNALLKGKGLELPQAYVLLGTVYSLPVIFVDQTEEMAKMSYEIAQQSGMTYYDATFLSVAKTIDGILVTDNIKHQSKFTSVKVIPLGKYR